MPSEFVTGDAPEYAGRSVPNYWTQDEIQSLATSHLINITGSWFTEEWGEAEGFGHDFLFCASRTVTPYEMYNFHTFPFWIFYLWDEHEMEWINQNGTTRGDKLKSNEIVLDAMNSSMGIRTARYRVECSHLYMIAYVMWNGTLYGINEAGLKSAWDADSVKVEFGIDAEEIGKSHVMSAWEIVALLLFFQLPDVHFALNALIALPLWTMIGILTFQLVIAVVKALPFT